MFHEALIEKIIAEVIEGKIKGYTYDSVMGLQALPGSKDVEELTMADLPGLYDKDISKNYKGLDDQLRGRRLVDITPDEVEQLREATEYFVKSRYVFVGSIYNYDDVDEIVWEDNYFSNKDKHLRALVIGYSKYLLKKEREKEVQACAN